MTTRPSALDRTLRLFTDVRAGESGTALLLTLNIFVIFVAYSLMKVLREGFGARRGRRGRQGGVGCRAGDRVVGRRALVRHARLPRSAATPDQYRDEQSSSPASASSTLCDSLNVSVGIVFYIWLGIFSVMVVAQFWGFANDVYTTEEGKRLFPIVMLGSSSGAVIGAWVPRFIQETIGVSQLFLVAAGLLVLSIAISNLVDARERRRTEALVPDVRSTGRPAPRQLGSFAQPRASCANRMRSTNRRAGCFPRSSASRKETARTKPPTSTGGAFQLVFRNRYLLLMAMMVLLLNWVNTGGENILSAFVTDAADRAVATGDAAGRTAEELINRFYSGYQGTVNLVGMLLQLFVVSRIIKYLSVPRAILFLPLVAFVGYTVILVVPLLGVLRWAKTAENATDYSLNNTVRQALFLPTTREEKYKAKQVVDSIAQRVGDVLAAVTWFGGTVALGLGYKELAAVNLGLVAIWLVIAVLIGRRYRRLESVAQG